jgi:hypothetical protein
MSCSYCVTAVLTVLLVLGAAVAHFRRAGEQYRWLWLLENGGLDEWQRAFVLGELGFPAQYQRRELPHEPAQQMGFQVLTPTTGEYFAD